MPRRILIIISCILGLFLLLFLFIKFLLPSNFDINTLPGILPKIVQKIIPGKTDSTLGDALTKTITIPDLVIDDENLTEAKQNITSIENTITEMKTKLNETQKKVKEYNDYKTLLSQGYQKNTNNNKKTPTPQALLAVALPCWRCINVLAVSPPCHRRC